MGRALIVPCSRSNFSCKVSIPAETRDCFSTGRVSRIRDVAIPPSLMYRGLAVAPNGRSMLYLQVEPGRANIMVASNFH